MCVWGGGGRGGKGGKCHMMECWQHPLEAVLTSTHNLCFEQKYEKYQVLYEKFHFFEGKIFNIFE